MKWSSDSQIIIGSIKDTLGTLKPAIYSKRLQQLDQKETEYEAGDLEIKEYLEYLLDSLRSLEGYSDAILFERGIGDAESRTSNYKNISLLQETLEGEKTINQQKILQESQNLLLNLQSNLQSKGYKKELQTLRVKASLFKDQKVSPFSFYSYLKGLSLKHLKDGIDNYPSLSSYITYLTKVNSIDSTKLFNEIQELTFQVKLELSRTEKEKLLTKALRNINFLEGFFNLKVSNEELDYYIANREEHKVEWFKEIIKRLKAGGLRLEGKYIDYNPDLIDEKLSLLEEFYKTVKARDIAMYNNSISEIEKRDVKVATLIHGGFHTKGITKLLRENNYSYIVVSPYSSTDIDEENYKYLLSGKRKPLSELIEELDGTLRVGLSTEDDTFLLVVSEALGVSISDIRERSIPLQVAYFIEKFRHTRDEKDIRYTRDRIEREMDALQEQLIRNGAWEDDFSWREIVTIDGQDSFHVNLGDGLWVQITTRGLQRSKYADIPISIDRATARDRGIGLQQPEDVEFPAAIKLAEHLEENEGSQVVFRFYPGRTRQVYFQKHQCIRSADGEEFSEKELEGSRRGLHYRVKQAFNRFNEFQKWLGKADLLTVINDRRDRNGLKPDLDHITIVLTKDILSMQIDILTGHIKVNPSYFALRGNERDTIMAFDIAHEIGHTEKQAKDIILTFQDRVDEEHGNLMGVDFPLLRAIAEKEGLLALRRYIDVYKKMIGQEAEYSRFLEHAYAVIFKKERSLDYDKVREIAEVMARTTHDDLSQYERARDGRVPMKVLEIVGSIEGAVENAAAVLSTNKNGIDALSGALRGLQKAIETLEDEKYLLKQHKPSTLSRNYYLLLSSKTTTYSEYVRNAIDSLSTGDSHRGSVLTALGALAMPENQQYIVDGVITTSDFIKIRSRAVAGAEDGVSESTAKKELAQMRRVNIIRTRQRGRNVLNFRLTADQLEALPAEARTILGSPKGLEDSIIRDGAQTIQQTLRVAQIELPKQFLAAAQGDVEAVKALLERVPDDLDGPIYNPELPWIAEAIVKGQLEKAWGELDEPSKGKVGDLQTYLARLNAAADRLAEQGFAAFSPNIRTGEEGYAWGPSVPFSFILRDLGIVGKDGKILDPGVLEALGLTPESIVAERWAVSDDTQYPSWVTVNGVAVPLFWLLRQYPEESLGKNHVEAFGAALGMVKKYLDAAEPLSWQVHLGITEGYVMVQAGEGAGIFLGINEPESITDRQMLISRAQVMLKNRNKRVVRMPQDGVPSLVSAGQITQFIDDDLIPWIDERAEDLTIAELVAHLLEEGRNIIDIAGFGLDKNGQLDPSNSLIQSIEVREGQRLVTRDGMPHSLFGRGDDKTLTLIELKATSTGPAHARTTSRSQTWAIADNLLGKEPRPGKVTLEKLKEALGVIGDLRPATKEDYAYNGEVEVQEIGEGVTSQVLHYEEQYYGRRITMEPGRGVYIDRDGRHSAFMVTNGRIQIFTSNGKLLGELGRSQDAFVMADTGDLIFKSIGEEPAIIIDFKRPVSGTPLPVPMLTRKHYDVASKERVRVFSARNIIRHNEKEKGSWYPTDVPANQAVVVIAETVEQYEDVEYLDRYVHIKVVATAEGVNELRLRDYQLIQNIDISVLNAWLEEDFPEQLNVLDDLNEEVAKEIGRGV